MQNTFRCLAGFFLILAASSTPAAEGRFTREPQASADGANVKISFALAEPTDVAVYIENADGHIVRHLVAGRLGDSAPAPLLAGKQEQTLTWDRRNDAGQPVPEGKYRIRVAAGLTPQYAGTAFEEGAGPANLTGVIGLAAGAHGRVYVLSTRWQRAWWTATAIHVYTRNGDYEKTIKPMPAGIPPEKLDDIGAFKGPGGHMTPLIHRILAMSFYPCEDTPQQFCLTPNGNLHFVVIPAAYSKPAIQRIASIDGNGGLPFESYAGRELIQNSDIARLNLAAGSDGKTLFLTGLSAQSAGFNASIANPPIVYSTTLPERAGLTPFFGSPKKTGADATALNNPLGLASDGEGRLLIADSGNNRVVILNEADAAFAGSFDVPSPSWVAVHAKTRAVYVLSQDSLVKFSGWKSPQELGRITLAPVPDRTRRFLALDSGSDPAVIWIGHSRGTNLLARIEEKDNQFGPLIPAAFRPAFTFWNVTASQDRERVGCKVGNGTLRILDEKTGATRDLRLGVSGIYRLGPNDQIYGMEHAEGIRRWDANGKLMPFPACVNEKNKGGLLANRPSGTTSWERDCCVDRNGNIYVKQRGKHYHGRMTVDVFDPTGKFLRTVIWATTDGAHGPRLDPAGNIYMAEVIKPLDKPYPDMFAEALATQRQARQQYAWMYGSIVKFGPEGGAFWFPVENKNDEYAFDGKPGLPAGLRKEKVSTIRDGALVRTPGEVEGALWWRYGCSYLLDMHVSHNQRCHCTATDFDVDDFGRTFYPDQGAFQVAVLDTAGNELVRFGGYGNQDSCGPDSYVTDPIDQTLRPRRANDPATLVSPFARPEIGIAWVTGLGVSDRYAYIADGLNRRVLRVKLGYQAEKTVDSP